MDEEIDQEFPPHSPFAWLDSFARLLRAWSVRLTLVVMFLSLIAAVLLPNFVRARAQGRLTGCKSNLKNIGTALAMWETDHDGHFPARLDLLMPNYLKTIPTCPNAGTYTYHYVGSEKLFTVICEGNNHSVQSMPPNYPQFTALQGLIER